MISNHPVHIFDDDGNESPSALIPFCQFGKNFSSMGQQSSHFNIPACSSFKEKFIENQRCYEVDVNQYKDGTFRSLDLKLGISFLVDTNYIRQTQSMRPTTKSSTSSNEKSPEDLGNKKILMRLILLLVK